MTSRPVLVAIFLTTSILITSLWSVDHLVTAQGDQDDLLVATTAVNQPPPTAVLLPNFRLPYFPPRDKLDLQVRFTGGPHGWNKGTDVQFTAYGTGSGLDFSAGGGNSFPVVAMADGMLIAANCGKPGDLTEFGPDNGGLGCVITIRHDVGNSVLTYAHLAYEETFQKWEQLLKSDIDIILVKQGDVLGKAGKTGAGSHGKVHLHLELRADRQDGPPIGWEDLSMYGGQIDGYWIYGYSEIGPYGAVHSRIYNYDGVAVKSSPNERQPIVGEFRFHDGTRYISNATTFVGPNFDWPRDDCNDGGRDCELNEPGSDTQFARTWLGGFWNDSSSALGGLTSGSAAAVDSTYTHGVLISTNRPPVRYNDNATFMRDVTLPDDAVVAPNQPLTKTWRLRNSGSSTWSAGYELAFVSGKQMSAPAAVAAPSAAPGQEVNVSVNLIAPAEPGKHRGYWQMRNPQGTYFGDRLWVQVEVPGGSAAPPPEAYVLECADCPAVVMPGATFRPVIRATVNSGQLVEGRGDMLRNTDGNLYGAWPHVEVKGIVDTGKTYAFQFYANNPIKAPTNLGIYESKWRLWQNGQFVGPELTIRFEVQNSAGLNHPPNAPTATGPDDWSVFTAAPTLSAQANGDPDGDAITGYYFEVFQSHDNPTSGWIGGSSWTPHGTGYYTYQWRARVRDSRGAESDWSTPRHFSVYNPQLSITQLEFVPLDGLGEQIRIRACTNGPSATMRVDVNTATDGSGRGEWKTIGELGVPCFNDIDAPVWHTLNFESGPHLVRVLARVGIDWGQAAVREQVYTVRADHRPNGPPNFTPRQGAYTASRTVNFDWDDAFRTSSYLFQVSEQANYGSLLVNVTLPYGTSQFSHTFDAEYPTLYARVIAQGPYGVHEVTSQIHIDQTPPASAVSPLPAVVTEDKFTVAWSGADGRSGLRWYHIQVREDNRPDSVWTDWLVNTTKTAEIFQGQPGRRYFFRARAMDAIGNWEAWPGGDGDTSTLVDPTSVPADSWWNSGYAWKHNLVILNNDGAALPAHYPVHIRLDGSTTPTAAEVYNASLANPRGNDVRLVYQNTTELNRVVQNFSPAQIDIWFPLAAAVGGGAAVNGDYQLYYGSAAAGSPPANANAVFLPEADANTVGLWHFQEGSGSTVYDSSGRAHHGTFVAPGWATGLHGLTGEFNGSTSIVEFGDQGDFNLTGAMTLEAWVYLSYLPDRKPVVISRYDNTACNYILRFRDYHVEFLLCGVKDGYSLLSDIKLTAGRWYHIAGVYNGVNEMRVYVNGVERSRKTDAGALRLSYVPLRIGGVPGWTDAPFPGYIHHARISNVARYSFPYGLPLAQPAASLGVARPRPIDGSADLRVLAVNTYPAGADELLVEVVVRNTGNLDTGNSFFTDVYLNHLPGGANDLDGSVRFWVNDPIPAGATVALTTLLDAPTLLDLGAAANATPAGQNETGGALFAQVDSTGVVGEPDNGDNITAQGTPFCLAEADSYEGDDDAAQATPLSPNQPQTHNLHQAGDQDWFAVQLSAGQAYTFSTTNLAANADTYLYLYDRDGATLIDANDDLEESLASGIHWQATGTGVYYLRVMHWNPNGGGCASAYTVEFAPDSPPGTPTLNAIDNPDGDGSYTVSWSAVAEAAGYTLHERLNSGGWGEIYNGPNTSLARAGQEDGQWCYRVRTTNGPSEWSGVVCTTVSTTVEPPVPVLASIDNQDSDGSYTVSWTSAGGALGYTLQERLNGEQWGEIFSGAGTSADLTGRSNGQWCYRVRAYNNSGNSPWSAVKCTTVKPSDDTLLPPTLNSIDNPLQQGAYWIHWTSVDNAASYELHENYNGSAFFQIYAESITSTYVTDRSVGLWCYRVRATKIGQTSDWSGSTCTEVKEATDTYRMYIPQIIR